MVLIGAAVATASMAAWSAVSPRAEASLDPDPAPESGFAAPTIASDGGTLPAAVAGPGVDDADAPPVAVSAPAPSIESSAATGKVVSAASTVGCAERDVTAAGLNEVFDDGIDAMVGADYQRAFEFDDGRVLWVFQDAFVDDGVGAPTLVHNAAVIQDGMCFELLVGGTEQRPASWIGADDTRSFADWYWPLDGYQADEDTFVLFVAEMEERGGRYLENATPLATWTVSIDLEAMAPGALERAPNPGDALYGFEITPDDEYLYLYGQCHRQFGFSWLGHDDCANSVFVARQPLDEARRPLEYWTGDGWTRNSRDAVNIAPVHTPDGAARGANPMQVERDGDRWIAVTKADDWWGGEVYFDVAPAPQGPWTTTAVLPVETQGDPEEVAAYFVSFVPSDEPGRTIAVSNNRWSGEFSDIYHPRFATVAEGLWSPREAEMVTARLGLPTGDRIGA